MTVKFKYKGKGWVSQPFGLNKEIYAPIGYPGGHPGIDTVNGWGKPVIADNPGLIYKIRQDEKTNASDVFHLVPVSDTTAIEIAYSHLSRILVKEGQTVVEGTRIGDEGNNGFVFGGGMRITPEMQDKGDRRGTHLHTQFRPVEKVKLTRAGQHVLNNRDGTRYRDKEGYYYRIIHRDNGFKGCVDPDQYKYVNSMWEDLVMVSRTLDWWKKSNPQPRVAKR